MRQDSRMASGGVGSAEGGSDWDRTGGFPGIVQPRGVRDAEQIQHIAVRGLRKMRFGRIAVLLDALRLQWKSKLNRSSKWVHSLN